MSLWFLLVFVGPTAVWLLYQLMVDDNARCSICQRVAHHVGEFGECMDCYEEAMK